ncbi:hypothetical protein HBH56_183200 [Parastagonospora nodorum]|uniref:Uncharacterized protein n=1 Tax=Phaeosphaeria nodorum (strain SN15 / ATCC MYA-4574 / FGSC 10173) TaxID=321614 RepID=A0A7U2FF82_PHANO|nr:hypothetical protein HBH56_183200 [Parastagonospora nodorum]QRD04154.1 hypothetical protein JI435_443080 [Parastagonospora nodorum SN15]KAH3925971.1 hypothetical protein HBH54_172350 [Parastagonospora nodorum]KAH4133617.1 hypothetical protein HBH45_176070 [Parastagonospora nodorum]KAH4153571.1 hypothetical protein HBH44_153920 [Parastagonospora nodorum]
MNGLLRVSLSDQKTQNHDFPAPPRPTPGDSMAEQTMALKTIYKTSNDAAGKKTPNRSPACLRERCAERSAIKHSSICNSSRSSNSTSEYPKPPTDLIKWGRCSKVKNLEGNVFLPSPPAPYKPPLSSPHLHSTTYPQTSLPTRRGCRSDP